MLYKNIELCIIAPTFQVTDKVTLRIKRGFSREKRPAYLSCKAPPAKCHLCRWCLPMPVKRQTEFTKS